MIKNRNVRLAPYRLKLWNSFKNNCWDQSEFCKLEISNCFANDAQHYKYFCLYCYCATCCYC